MKPEHVYTLLEKYWNCETSVAEEDELRNFFCNNDVPDHLKQFAPIFEYNNALKSCRLSDTFDAKLNAAIKQSEGEKKYITIKVLAPVFRIVASFVLAAGLGISIFLIAKQNNKTNFQETYNDPNTAIKHATVALEKLSNALRVGENSSIETLLNIDEMDIDWMSVDSLNIPLPTMDNGLQDNDTNKDL